MKSALILCALFALAFGDTYKTTYDGIDVEAAVTNPESLKAFTECFLDQAPCNEVAATFKRVLPEITEQACTKCTAAQKHMLRRYFQEMFKTSEDDFKALKQKYDPENKYVDALRQALADA